MRLTKSVVEQLLTQNEGFRWETYSRGNNFRERRVYRIVDGVVRISAQGKTSWAASRFNDEWVADAEQTRRFLRSVLGRLNTEGLE